jgi:hypothetical protein
MNSLKQNTSETDLVVAVVLVSSGPLHTGYLGKSRGLWLANPWSFTQLSSE